MPLVLTALLMLFPLVAPSVGAGQTCLRPPVVGPIVEHFQAPPCPYCAGNRGIRFSVVPGAPVSAAAAGVVTFSGRVVDTYYVVVRHGDGLRATYGGLAGSSLRPGAVVATGSYIGPAAGRVYFGLRDEHDTYLDPEPLLGRLMEQWRLVPTDGSPARPAPPPVLRCSR